MKTPREVPATHPPGAVPLRGGGPLKSRAIRSSGTLRAGTDTQARGIWLPYQPPSPRPMGSAKVKKSLGGRAWMTRGGRQGVPGRQLAKDGRHLLLVDLPLLLFGRAVAVGGPRGVPNPAPDQTQTQRIRNTGRCIAYAFSCQASVACEPGCKYMPKRQGRKTGKQEQTEHGPGWRRGGGDLLLRRGSLGQCVVGQLAVLGPVTHNPHHEGRRGYSRELLTRAAVDMRRKFGRKH